MYVAQTWPLSLMLWGSSLYGTGSLPAIPFSGCYFFWLPHTLWSKNTGKAQRVSACLLLILPFLGLGLQHLDSVPSFLHSNVRLVYFSYRASNFSSLCALNTWHFSSGSLNMLHSARVMQLQVSCSYVGEAQTPALPRPHSKPTCLVHSGLVSRVTIGVWFLLGSVFFFFLFLY